MTPPQPTVVVDNGSHGMRNLGDIAMLQMTVARVRARWPGARVRVVTEQPERLAIACPGAEPLMVANWDTVDGVERLARWLPRRVRWVPIEAAQRGQLALPGAAHAVKRLARRDADGRLAAFYDAVRSADAVVTCGGGFVNDHFRRPAWSVLSTVALAQRWGKPTAMFGQGIGPITDRALRRIAADVFRKLNVLAVRERRASTDELTSLGVPLDQVTITGDDAIELAPASPPADGSGLGVNLRIAKYADVAADVAPTVGRILRRVADELNAPLLPLPVRLPPLKGDDVEAVRQLFPDGGVDTSVAERMDLPGDLVAEAARCRVVVSGSYHSAVFALAQGVPVVGLAVSRYYREKLTGLAEQFGAGAEVVSVDDPDPDRTLPEAIHRLWTAAPAVRVPLLAAAERQRQLSRAAYDRFFDLVESRLARRGGSVPSVTPASS